jgi:hypothetical protein
VRLAYKDGVAVALIVDVDVDEVEVEVEVEGVDEVAEAEAEEERVTMETIRQILPKNERGRTRIKRVGETIIGRGVMIRRWQELELVLLPEDSEYHSVPC